MIPNPKWAPTAQMEQTGLILQHGTHFANGMSIMQMA